PAAVPDPVGRPGEQVSSGGWHQSKGGNRRCHLSFSNFHHFFFLPYPPEAGLGGINGEGAAAWGTLLDG
ncbi:MAG TPA: hypothetical protein VFG87_03460, partial [Amycolatopsis sp.]|nr:hypothetical protein [Amycolatopsis sp.]